MPLDTNLCTSHKLAASTISWYNSTRKLWKRSMVHLPHTLDLCVLSLVPEDLAASLRMSFYRMGSAPHWTWWNGTLFHSYSMPSRCPTPSGSNRWYWWGIHVWLKWSRSNSRRVWSLALSFFRRSQDLGTSPLTALKYSSSQGCTML